MGIFPGAARARAEKGRAPKKEKRSMLATEENRRKTRPSGRRPLNRNQCSYNIEEKGFCYGVLSGSHTNGLRAQLPSTTDLATFRAILDSPKSDSNRP